MSADEVAVGRLRPSDPARVGGYSLRGRLGSGGTAEVYLADCRRTGPVALKVIRANVDGGRRLCRREYHMMSRVGPATAPPLGYGSGDRGAFFAMRYLAGYTPAHALGPGLLAGAFVVLAHALARTLTAVHAAGVIHCDVKPANMLVRDDDVRLIDFGIARTHDHQPPPSGIVYCSRGWAAPEQLRGGPVGYQADVFAWGCVVAYLASGVHPFASHTEQEWLLRVFSAEPELWALPPVLADPVRAALQRDPTARPTAAELVQLTG